MTSKELQSVKLTGTMNYHIEPGAQQQVEAERQILAQKQVQADQATTSRSDTTGCPSQAIAQPMQNVSDW